MKKLAVYLSIVCSLLIVSLTLFSKTVQAETSKKSRCHHGDQDPK